MAKYTQKAIIESFMELLQKKSLDKITVKDIIEETEVNRNTFYYHFQDIYDLLESAFEEEAVKFRSEADPKNNFYEEYIRTVNFLLDHSDAIIHIYNSKSRDVIKAYLESAASFFIGRFVEEAAEGSKLSENGKNYIIYFYTDAIIGITLRWIEGSMMDSKEVLIKTVSDSFNATVKQMVTSYIESHPEECK
ncbi:MAG: TetR/AcrR family transcriptional regulator [Peptoniphilus lacrimalis]|uniref:TetR/AcrR family transcriptional regulator n=1 Tax=Peptoniphilus lacrimalis TaxID=33031 RepID=UPI00254D3777|nr:TetR/AcrR family transcriptional regulator [Peptoniphilus lacrimalis]MDK8282705.1 TetR/AcrR family transcriptional regulator [Peptoniphilus lacrimalis]